MSSTTIRSARRSSFTASAVRSTRGRSSNRKPKRGGVGVGLVITASTPAGPEQVGQPRLAAETVAVGIDVGGEADPLSRLERGGELVRGGPLVGREGVGHEGIVARTVRRR